MDLFTTDDDDDDDDNDDDDDDLYMKNTINCQYCVILVKWSTKTNSTVIT